jgi:hypothetical protein
VDTVNQRLGFQDKELVDDDSMVAEHGIVANSRLWLINTGEHVDRDIAGKILNQFDFISESCGFWCVNLVYCGFVSAAFSI